MSRKVLSLLSISALIFITTTTIVSCSSDDNAAVVTETKTKAAILSDHDWITTKIVDNKGNNISLDVMPGAMYAGYAYYNPDGTFRIVDFKDGHKMYGLWSLKDNETKRHLVVYNAKNEVAYERTVDLIEVNDKVFTYAIPDNSNPEIIYYVEHKPVTNHAEPKTPAEILASVDWTTTKVLDITKGVEQGIELDRTVAPAANFSGDAYYVNNNGKAYFPKNKEGKYVNGTFQITAYGSKETVRSQGDWYVSLDGKTRTLIARNTDGSVAFERTVTIVELSENKFTYDIQAGDALLRVEHKPIQK